MMKQKSGWTDKETAQQVAAPEVADLQKRPYGPVWGEIKFNMCSFGDGAKEPQGGTI